MIESTLIEFMTGRQVALYLREIERKGKDHILQDWITEGLQDRGLIDHNDQLTADGKNILKQHRSHSG